MLSTILSILTSSGLGAILGLIGSFLTKKEETKALKAKLDYEVKMAEIRKEEARLEAEANLKIVEAEGIVQQGLADTGAFRESLKEQSKIYGIKFVDAIRGIVRPLITLYLLIIATYIAMKVNSYIGGMQVSLTYNEMLIIYKDIIAQVFFLVTTAVTWWFGSRPTSGRK